MKVPRYGDLGPKQLAWCRANIPFFEHASDGVLAVKKEMDANRQSMPPVEDKQ